MSILRCGIQARFLCVNMAIVVMFSIFSTATWRWMHVLQSEATDTHDAAALVSTLLQRELDHLLWAQKVSTYLMETTRQTLDVQTDDHLCAFGAWYFGAGRKTVEQTYPDVRDALTRLEAPHRQLHESATEIAARKQSGDTAAAHEHFVSVSLPRMREVQSGLAEIRAHLTEHGENAAVLLTDNFATIRMTSIGASAGAISLGLLLSFLAARAIIRPLRTLVGFSQAVANGDTNAVLTLERQDELGQLAASMNAMVQTLRNQLAYSQGVLNGMTVPCSIFSKDDTTVFTNQHMLDLIERDGSPVDYHGQKSGQFLYGNAATETISTAALREGRLITASRDVTTHKGALRHVAISSAPFRNTGGEILGTLSIWIDMTESVTQSRKVQEQNNRIMDVARQLERVVEVVGSAAEQLSAQAEQASRGADLQSRRLAETATAMEEMTATVIEVAQNASKSARTTEDAKITAQYGATIVGDVVRGIDDVQVQSLSLRDHMTSLGQQAEGIGRILGVISDIADQINLLALNAAIEAARAGDAGRGFAVVADEVRKLAEKTMIATQEVDTVIRAIQDGTQTNIRHVEQSTATITQTTTMAANSGTALRDIVSLVDAASDQVRAIATAAEEQSATSEEINRAVDEVNRVAAETARVMTESAQAVMELARQASTLSALVREMQTAS